MLRKAGGRWHLWLALVSLGGAVPGIAWVLAHRLHAKPAGDAFNFYTVAKIMVTHGYFFIDPLAYTFHHQVLPSAQHPPLWSLVLAFFYLIGLHSYPAQLIGACFVGSAAVYLTGLAGHAVGGKRVGLVAAVLAAVYPNYWINYSLGLSETLVLALIAAVVLLTVRVWQQPTLKGVVALCAVCALAALTRAEQILLFAAVVLPLVVMLKGVDRRQKVQYLAVGAAVAVVLMGPWVGFNLSRFSKTTTFSTDLGTTLQMANCRFSFYGPHIGSGDFRCLAKVHPSPGDESVHDGAYRSTAEHYIKRHIEREPLVMVTRVAREFGLYTPRGQLQIENYVNYRPIGPARAGLVMYYVLVIAGIYGAVLLRRRRFTLLPFVGITVVVVLTAMATFGQTRYRVPVEVVLVILSAVTVDTLWTCRSDKRAAAAPRRHRVRVRLRPPTPPRSPLPSADGAEDYALGQPVRRRYGADGDIDRAGHVLRWGHRHRGGGVGVHHEPGLVAAGARRRPVALGARPPHAPRGPAPLRSPPSSPGEHVATAAPRGATGTGPSRPGRERSPEFGGGPTAPGTAPTTVEPPVGVLVGADAPHATTPALDGISLPLSDYRRLPTADPWARVGYGPVRRDGSGRLGGGRGGGRRS